MDDMTRVLAAQQRRDAEICRLCALHRQDHRMVELVAAPLTLSLEEIEAMLVSGAVAPGQPRPQGGNVMVVDFATLSAQAFARRRSTG